MSVQPAVESVSMTGQEHIDLVERFAAHNYHPLPIVVAKAEGVWVEDADGKRYMDMLAAYSAVNFGHCNPDLIAAATEQLARVTLTSRAFHNDQLGPLCKELADLCGMEAILPMNTGAEGVETAVKTARKWGYMKKGVPEGKARIICCENNFHGRTTTIISFSTDPQCRAGFGPFTPGFTIIKYGDIEALRRAIDDNTVAFLVEPICCDHENVKPDIFILGKALGGGIMPVSAVVSSREILSVFNPGDHGSTFGGNPLSCAVARKVVEILKTDRYQENARKMGGYLFGRLRSLKSDKIKEIRGRGLWVGIEFHPAAGAARQYCERLMHEGMLCKDTHEQTMRLAPPLCINQDEIDWAFERLEKVLT
jgi:ornithine--oxo-acid transaminase